MFISQLVSPDISTIGGNGICSSSSGSNTEIYTVFFFCSCLFCFVLFCSKAQ